MTTVLVVGGLAFAAPAGAGVAHRAAGNATIVVDPSTDLVAGQSVHVSGGGFDPSTSLGSAECKAAPVSTSDCDLSNTVLPTSDPSGNYEFDFTVQPVLVTNNGPVDCTASDGACVLAVGETANLPGTTVTAPLSFAATGPPQGGELQIPNARVAGDTSIELTGTQFAPVSPIDTAECTPDATSVNDCNEAVLVTSDGSGAFDTFFDAPTSLVTPNHDPIDCTVDGSCVFAAWDFRDFASTLTTAPIKIAPEVAGTLAVDPSTGLVDGTSVNASGSGWPADQFLYLAECDGTDQTADCTNESSAITDGDGTFSTSVRVNITSSDGTVDCAHGPCWIVASWYAENSTPTAAQPITFNLTTTPVTSHYTADELTAVSGAATTLGVSNEEVQRLGSWGLAWVLGITGTGTITPVPDTGPGTITTDWTPTEYGALTTFAAQHGTTVPEFQKTGALFLAFVLALQ